MTTPIERHVGFITSNDTSPLIVASERAAEASRLMGSAITEASAATRRAAALVVTASSDVVRAKAAERLAFLQVSDAMNAQAAEAGRAAAAMADAARAPLAALEEQAAAYEAASVKEAASVAALRNKVVADYEAMAAAAKESSDELALSGSKVDASAAAGAGGGALAKAGGAAGLAGVAATVGLGAAGVESVKAATQFQQSTELFRTSAGASQQAVDELQKGILQLAGQVAFGPNNLSAAMYAVVGAGYSGADALNIQKQAALGAHVGNADLVQTTDALVGTMKALNAPASSAAQVMGQLQAIVGSGKLTFDQMNAALGTGVIPTMQTAGVSLQSFGAALSYMTDRSIPADQAATRLRMTVALLSGPSTTSAKALHALGLTNDEIVASSDSMASALSRAHVTTTQLADDLRKPDGINVALTDLMNHFRTAGVSADEARAILGKVFGGGRSDAAAEALINDLEGVRQKYDQIGQTASNSSSAITATQQTQAYQLQQLKANVQTLEVEFGQKLLPTLESIVSWVNAHWGEISADMKRAWTDGEQAFGGFIEYFYDGLRHLSDAFLDAIGDIVHAAAGVADALHLPFRHGLDEARSDIDSFHLSLDTTFTNIANEAATWGHDSGANFGNNFLASVSTAVDQARSIIDNARLANPGEKNTLGGVGSQPYGPAQPAAAGATAGQANANGGVGGQAYGPAAPANASTPVFSSSTDDTSGITSLGGGGGGYTAPATIGGGGGGGGGSASKAIDETAESIKSLRASESSLSIEIARAVKGSQAQQQQALQDAQSMVQQAQSTELAAVHTKDHTAAVLALNAAKREQMQIQAAILRDPLTKLQNTTSSLQTRAQAAPDPGQTTASAQAALRYDDITVASAKHLLQQSEAFEKSKAGAKQHADALAQVKAAQDAFTTAQKAALTAQNDLNTAMAQARQDSVDLANAQSALTVIGGSALAQAQIALAAAQRQLGIDVQGTTKWFQDQAAVMQDVLDVSTAASTAATQAQQDAVDLANAQLEANTDPSNAIAVAQAKVTEANNQLAIDIAGTTKYFTDLAALHQAQNDLTSATTSATSALTSLASSVTTTSLPSYLADRVAATSSSYVQPVTITVQVAGSLVGGTTADLADALTPMIRSGLNDGQRRARQPLLAG